MSLPWKRAATLIRRHLHHVAVPSLMEQQEYKQIFAQIADEKEAEVKRLQARVASLEAALNDALSHLHGAKEDLS